MPPPVLVTTSESDFGQLARQMGKLMEQLQRGYFSYCPAETWTPAVNLYENDSAYVVCVDLAGVAKEKIEVVVADGRLKLRGARPTPVPAPGGGSAQQQPPSPPSPPPPPQEGDARVERVRVHLMEIDHGPFSREVELPDDVEVDRVTAQYLNGMLWIELPKK